MKNINMNMNMVNLQPIMDIDPLSRYGPYVTRICNRDNFGHDRLKMGTKKTYFIADNFSGEKIKKKNLHYVFDS